MCEAMMVESIICWSLAAVPKSIDQLLRGYRVVVSMVYRSSE